MDILIVTQYFWPELFRINDLAEGLVARGHQVTVLTGKPNYPKGKFFTGYNFLNKHRESFGPITIIRSPLIPRGSKKFQLALNYFSFAFFASIVGIFCCKKPDVIFVYEPSPITVGIPAIVLKKIKKAPIIFWVQDLWPESIIAIGAIRSNHILKLIKKLTQFIYKKCDTILVTSKAYIDSITKFDVPSKKIHYFPQTAEALYRPIASAHLLPEEKILPKGFRIMFSGNIGSAQNIENILEAAKILKEHTHIQWIFIGDGSKRKWLQDEIKNAQLTKTVCWLGQHAVESMPRFFSCADVLLVSLKDDPVFSLTIPAKIQSYLACAKPIIAALDGEGKKIIEEAQAGLAISINNPKELAEAALQLSQLSQDHLLQMGINGRRYFDQHFNRDSLLENLETWMVELKEKN